MRMRWGRGVDEFIQHPSLKITKRSFGRRKWYDKIKMPRNEDVHWMLLDKNRD
jgi:hypothetical protein